jgi:hypothetical protein
MITCNYSVVKVLDGFAVDVKPYDDYKDAVNATKKVGF